MTNIVGVLDNVSGRGTRACKQGDEHASKTFGKLLGLNADESSETKIKTDDTRLLIVPTEVCRRGETFDWERAVCGQDRV